MNIPCPAPRRPDPVKPVAVEKHTIHCRDGGKVIIEGDRIEIHPPGPIVIHRSQWTRHLSPREEMQRALNRGGPYSRIEAMLEEAFKAVPMTVHADPSDD